MREETITGSIKTINAKFNTYKLVKQLLKKIDREGIRINQYRQSAESLALLIKKLETSKSPNIFNGYYRSISPYINGNAKTYMSTCRKLLGEIEKLFTIRIQLSNITIL